jgi:hypothetical protein
VICGGRVLEGKSLKNVKLDYVTDIDVGEISRILPEPFPT